MSQKCSQKISRNVFSFIVACSPCPMAHDIPSPAKLVVLSVGKTNYIMGLTDTRNLENVGFKNPREVHHVQAQTSFYRSTNRCRRCHPRRRSAACGPPTAPDNALPLANRS